MTWLLGPADRPTSSNIPAKNRHLPIAPRLPTVVLNNPFVLGLMLAGTGVALSVTIITTMHRWPAWTLMPSMIIAVVAMAATAIGSSILVAMMMQPMIESRDNLNWSETPLTTLGISLHLQRQCQHLGFWTCESVGRAVEAGTFPWTDLSLDERRQLHGSILHWQGLQRHSDGN